jgi:hypothetical protein
LANSAASAANSAAAKANTSASNADAAASNADAAASSANNAAELAENAAANVKDGVGIKSVEQTTTSAESGGMNVVTVTKTDNSKSTFEVVNGKGEFDGIQNVSGADITMELQPNILYVFGEVTSLSLTLATPSDTTRVNEYMFQFTSGTTATTLTLPSTVKWIGSNGVAASMVYQVSIVNNLAVMGGTSNA